jgi:hypothetical protein
VPIALIVRKAKKEEVRRLAQFMQAKSKDFSQLQSSLKVLKTIQRDIWQESSEL